MSSVILSVLMLMSAAQLSYWFSGNTQFLVNNQKFAIFVCILGGVLGSIFAFLAARKGYGNFTMWEIRMMGFASSYFTFPVLTWWFFNESILNPKTAVSIGISFLLVCVQVFWKQ